MRTILKNLKKHTITIILVIIFLFIQAMCELSLPDYTAKIVDVGIRQNGIEDNVFEKIEKNEFEKLLSISDNENIKDYYEEKNETYYLKNIKEEERKELSELLIDKEILILMTETKNIPIEMSEQTNIQLDPEIKKQLGIEYVKQQYQKTNTDIVKKQNKYITQTGIKMISLALLAAIITIIVSYLTSKLSSKFGKDLRREIVEKVMTFGSKEMKEIGQASLITRSTNDISRIQMFITMLLRIAVFAPIMGIGALLKVINNEMNFILIIGISLILILVIILFVVAIPKFKLVQDLIDKVNLIFRESLNGIPVIRAFTNEKREEERFDDANKELNRINLFVTRIMATMMPTMTFIMNFLCVLIIYVGSKKIDTGAIQIGTLMAFIQYTIQIIMSFLLISMMSIMFPRAWISIKRIKEVYELEPQIKEPEVIDDIGKKFKGTVEFKEVYFRYHDADEDILENISFKAIPGTTTAIIGSTGSGKSTLVNLIPRFFDVTGGKILIDGIDIRKIDLYDLRENIGYISQKGVLFTGTIKSNIAFGHEKINKKQLELAAEISQSQEFINEKEKKFDSEISQSGTNVSGGQKQRLSIARAIYKNPSIYIFDDSFSALDFKTDKNLRHELKKITKQSTVLIVAQRISTVLNADQIIVLDEGKVVGIGKHEELLKKCKVYKEIAQSQLSEEELKNGK
jgi:ATP-binding cassette subfamily B protein